MGNCVNLTGRVKANISKQGKAWSWIFDAKETALLKFELLNCLSPLGLIQIKPTTGMYAWVGRLWELLQPLCAVFRICNPNTSNRSILWIIIKNNTDSACLATSREGQLLCQFIFRPSNNNSAIFVILHGIEILRSSCQ